MNQVSAYNATGMKTLNKRKILEYIRRQPCSRAELARMTGLTRAAITVIVDQLLTQGLLMEGEAIVSRVGRTSHRLLLNAKRYCTVGLSIGRKAHEVGLSLWDGTLIRSAFIDTACEEQPGLVIKRLCEEAKKLYASVTPQPELIGIGIVAPGPIQKESGMIMNPPYMDSWYRYHVVEAVKQYFSVPVIFERDVNAIALAERYYGVGKEYQNFLELNLDTGVGGGMILNGGLYTGNNDFGGQIGHMTIDVNGPVCRCGNIGCAELYASIPNLVGLAERINPAVDSWKHLIESARNGDTQMQAVLTREGFYLASVILNVWNVVDIDAAIISGDAVACGDILIREIKHSLAQRLPEHMIGNCAVLFSDLPDHSMMLGACNLVTDFFVKNII